MSVPVPEVKEFCAKLRSLWVTSGSPQQNRMAARLKVAKQRVSEVLSGTVTQPDWTIVEEILRTCTSNLPRADQDASIEWWKKEHDFAIHANDRVKHSRKSVARTHMSADVTAYLNYVIQDCKYINLSLLDDIDPPRKTLDELFIEPHLRKIWASSFRLVVVRW